MTASDVPTQGQQASINTDFNISCEWPKFSRAQVPLKTKNAGQCDSGLAATYGGDCENFHWLGLMGDPTVMVAPDGKFKMWFSSGERSNSNTWSPVIAYTESVDGILWDDPKDLMKDAIKLFPTGTAGLDETGSETPFVFRDLSGTYQMLYTGDRGVTPNNIHVIGRATSMDGKTWTKELVPALIPTLPWEQPFDAGGFQVGGVLEPSVLVGPDGYRLWYQGFGQHAPDSPAYSRFGYATSQDGRSWIKQAQPVFSGNTSDFDRAGTGHVNVIRDPRGKFHMFYVGISVDETLRIGHATSADGINWNRNPNNPIIEGKAGEWDAGLVGGPSAVIINGDLYVYYMGAKTKQFTGVHFARAKASCN